MTQRVSGGPECVFSISTLEALVQQGGSWHLEETQISHLKMVPFKVSFSLEFALLHGEINYNNPFYFFQERKGLGPATFVCLGALSRWVLCFIPALQEDTGPSSALQGSPVFTQYSSALTGKDLSSFKGACRCLWRPDQLPRPGDWGLRLL